MLQMSSTIVSDSILFWVIFFVTATQREFNNTTKQNAVFISKKQKRLGVNSSLDYGKCDN